MYAIAPFSTAPSALQNVDLPLRQIMSLFLDLANLGEQLSATKKKLEHSALIGAYLKQIEPLEIAPAARLLIGRIFSESDARSVNISGAALNRELAEVVCAHTGWPGSA